MVTFQAPLPGTDVIAPLNTVAQIKEMGVALDNCLAGEKLAAYVNHIAVRKDKFLYKFQLNKTFQAVFSLKKLRGKWFIDELEHDPLPELTYVKLEMMGEIEKWLRKEQEDG